ncbi:MAG: DUF2007 domain-containing protein [Alphaproteobacteria bacterium]|nr:DUF2007 domain-containing protein [Alphaproteobacteria bacterium]
MQELLRTNDVVLVSFLEALLTEAGIPVFVLDVHMSVLDGSISAIPRRVMVRRDDFDAARRLVSEAGVDLGPGP